MRRVLQVRKDVKARRARVKELMGLNLHELGREIKLQLIQELIPLGLMHVGEVLQEDVKVLARGFRVWSCFLTFFTLIIL
ncbi:MAG TPA: hypothetical protein VMX95_02245 [Thermodesulfobacteriota bacterium]|nr:hypothetical protein [Thermodesulfobacteriota bacterium]